MAMTDAQRRAKAAYQRKVKQVIMRFYPNNARDEAIYGHIKSRENANEYLKGLVERDMRKAGREGK